ncbi:AMP-binding protein [Natrinema sp. 1APR25-10V2]|uniref:class I adenylate-forming enzyme family protein n=1 Tax=Natrinema sp. 1APR25-10V2 TaxID=2951081 RepID=UPI0028767E8B|nr:AMP-binding protein [Natrinema sp. 1APR25-10V2]MDS0476974.1 AMP-binding protein [Natrinema sp. 1APR25-10V2]
MNFANCVDRAARDDPERTAIVDPNRELTFGELAAETNAFAKALEELGVEPNERVALYLPNSVTFVVAYFGAMKYGAIPFPINMRFEGNEIQYVLEDAGAAVVVTSGEFEDTMIDLDVDSLEHSIVANGEHGLAYKKLVQDAGDDYSIYPRKEDEVAELMYTSGTTGRPKGVKHTHGNLSTNARGFLRYMNWGQSETALTVCPCFHVSGLNITTTPYVFAGATNHFLPAWDPETALETMAEREVTYTFLIPTMVIDLLNYDGIEEYDLSALDVIGVGGAPMPKERIEAVEQTFDCTLLEGYGMTETTPLAAINQLGAEIRKAGSIGTVCEEVMDVRIEHPETNEEVGVNEKGELLWSGDTVMDGYYNLPEKNEETFVERNGRTWFRSGDIGRKDENDLLFIEDRIDDMIITGGENVYPREVEDVLYGLDGVEAAAVVGASDDRLGEQVVAFVVGETTEEALDTGCREWLAGYKVPREFRFVEELPKTSTRKIDKVSLRERLD